MSCRKTQTTPKTESLAYVPLSVSPAQKAAKPSWCISSGSVKHHDFIDTLDYASRLGLNGVELILKGDESPSYLMKVQSASVESGTVVKGIHAPFLSKCKTSYALRPFSTVDWMFRKAVEAAEILNAERITFHPLPALFSKTKYSRILIKALEKSRNSAFSFSLENPEPKFFPWARNECWCLNSLHKFIRFVRLMKLSITFDTSHWAVRGMPCKPFLIVAGQYLDNIHLSDADHLQCHKPIGQGRIDFSKLLHALKSRNYSGSLTLEVEPADMNSIKTDFTKLMKASPESWRIPVI